MIQQLRYTVRSLLGAPVFTTVAVITLALGIGVNSSMYSLMNSLMFTSTPFPHPESIVNLNGQTPGAEFMGFSAQEIEALRAHSSSAFTFIAPESGTLETVTLPGQLPESMTGAAAHPDLFKIMETPPLLGRVFTPEECVAGRDAVVLITEALWRKQFGASPDAIGRTMRIGGRLFTIIGVLPKVYSTPLVFGDTQYFRPLVYSKDQLNGRDARYFALFARLAPGASFRQALTSLAPVSERWAKDFPQIYPNYRLRMQIAGRIGDRPSVTIVSLLVVLALAILGIACANLANLQMARAAGRIRDLAIRSALGASRWALIKQQMLESLVLSLAGGTLGLLLATWSNDLVGRNVRLNSESANTLDLPIDGHVLAFTAAISILAGLGFGLIPGWLASRTDVNETLKQQSRGTTGGRRQGWIRSLLVIGQVALSLALLSVAGMMIHGLNRTSAARPNWDTESILTANVQIDDITYDTAEKKRAFDDALSAKLAAIPGVEAFALASMLPTGGGNQTLDIFKEGDDSSVQGLPRGNAFLVTPGYFKTLGIRLLEGKTFPENVSPTAVEQVVVNQTLARHFWPDQSAVGHRLGTKGSDGKVVVREIIGVVTDAEDAIAINDPVTRMQFYTTLAHSPWSWFQVVVRGPNPKHFANDLRRAVADVSPDVAARFVWTLEDTRKQYLRNVQVINGLMLAFALLGLVLASVGLYGIVTNNVNQRMAEFGIRLALGARQTEMMRLILSQNLRLSLIGLILGAVGSLVLSLALRKGIGPMVAQNGNFLIVSGTSAVIFAVAFLATWYPARRAVKVDPMIALRAE